jgi:hypothetical protein
MAATYPVTELDPAAAVALALHAADTTAVHGIADTALLETATGAQTKATAAQAAAVASAAGSLAAHEADATAVHGIADTAALVLTNDARLSDQRVPTALSVTDAKVAAGAAIAETKLALASDAAAGTASRRTIGTGALQAAAGNDSRLSDQRVPTDGSVISAKFPNGRIQVTATTSEHQLFSSPAGALDNLSMNVAAVKNTKPGSVSGMRFLASDGIEKAAIGFGQDDMSATYPFAGAAFIEASNTILADGSVDQTRVAIPMRFVITGKISGTYSLYCRMEFDVLGNTIWYDLNGWSAVTPVMKLIAGNNQAGSLGIGKGGTYGGAAIPAASLDVWGKTVLGDTAAESSSSTRISTADHVLTVLSLAANSKLLRLVRNNVGKVDVEYKNDGTGSLKRLEFIDTDNSAKVPLTIALDGSRRIFQGAPASAPTDAHLAASTIHFYLDEAGANLKVRVKYADGTTLKTATIALV